MDRLDLRIRSLPQELQDEILDYYLIPKKKKRVKIDSNYKPPWQLQFDQRSRRSLIPCFYSQQTFKLGPSGVATVWAYDWLRSLPPAARNAIKTVRFKVPFVYRCFVLSGPTVLVQLDKQANFLRRVLDNIVQEGMTRDWLYLDVWLESNGRDTRRQWMNENEIKIMLEQMRSSER